MEFPSKPSPLPATPLVLRPGDFSLGSLESRAAARAWLDEKRMSDQQNRSRVTVEHIGKPFRLETATCIRRYEGDGCIFEIVDLDGAQPTETQAKQIERWIRKVPIDGKKHSFAEQGA